MNPMRQPEPRQAIQFPNVTGQIEYIVPDSTIWLLSGTGLDNSYRHSYGVCTRTVQQQFDFFRLNFVRYMITKFSPISMENAINVEKNANDIYDCDYMIFQNANYSNRYFYAFITKIEWVNTEISKIYYEIDVMQTWFRELRMNPVFIERCHAERDEVGDNLKPENLELGEYVIFNDSETKTGFFNSFYIVVAASVDKNGEDSTGAVSGQIYSGLNYMVFTSAASVNTFLDKLTTQNKSSAVVSIFMYPKAFVTSSGTWTAYKSYSTPKNITKVGTYTPRNKKLLTYPFNFLLVSNMAGGAATFRYEFFNSSNCQFQIFMDYTPNPTAICTPLQYKCNGLNWNEKLTMDGFPQCGWTIDTYKAWLAQNGSQTGIHNLGTAFSAITKLLTGNIAGAIGSGFTIAESMAKISATEALPPQAHGAAGNSTLMSASAKDFYFLNMGITPEYAISIDQYFDMFGYSQKRVMTLNIHLRKAYNYIQTINCVLGNNGAPSPAHKKICQIFDAGITFWHGNYLGNYSVDNTPGAVG